MLDMIKCSTGGAYYARGEWVPADGEASAALAAKGFDAAAIENAKTGTMAYSILQAHNTSGDAENLKIKFDAMASHDITFVGIIQTARASGLEKFPIPYVLTNCHNSLCAVGGTINEDDHRFGLSAAKKYGGIFVPPHMAVIHQYMRERFAGCGKMILGSDSHTRYGALGTMAIGEGGGELAKQLLGRTYDVARPGVVAICLTGALPAGCGPHDVAIALVGELFKSGYVKNKVMEFVGPGIASLRQDTRNAIDAMTTETTCLSSIWETDEKTRQFLTVHGRAGDYKPLHPAELAYYDGVVSVDLSKIRPMIALPMHPSNAFTIEELNANLEDILHACEQDVQKLIGRKDVQLDLCSKIENGKLRVDQGVIAGCAGGLYDSIYEAASILKGHTGGCGDYALSVYPGSQPIMMELNRTGVLTDLMASGATIRTAFCGPCFGAGDVPANGALSIRHTTRNFPSREGSKPGSGQLAGVALMDARSIAATTANGGILTPATDIDYDPTVPEYQYDASSYDTRVYQGFGKGDYDALLKLGPNIKDWPEIAPLGDNLLLKVASYITDPVTTTDELIPSGETSSYRSNPLGLAEFTLSRKDPEYVGRAKAVNAMEAARLAKVKRYVFASSLYVYSQDGGFYRCSKQSCEVYIENYQAMHNLPYTILRYGSLYGPRSDRRNAINRFVYEALTTGGITYYGAPTALREYVHVDDASAATLAVLDPEFENQNIIISGNQPMRVGDLFKMIGEMLGKELNINYMNDPNSGHYQVTPYAFMPKVCRKLVPPLTVDLGQGILRVMEEEHKELHPELASEGGYLVPTDD